ncbi:MAG: hypothetical protein ABW171_14690, partial [Steroidobacter sp.]
MQGFNDDLVMERPTAASACLDVLCPSAERSRRAKVAIESVHALSDYRTYLSAIDAQRDKDCTGLRGPLSERAFAAEGTFRVLMAEGLRSVNDLRDSGMLDAGLSAVALSLERGDMGRVGVEDFFGAGSPFSFYGMPPTTPGSDCHRAA